MTNFSNQKDATTKASENNHSSKPKIESPSIQTLISEAKRNYRKKTLTKTKILQDSYYIPEEEHDQLAMLKARLGLLGQKSKKSELIRAGIQALLEMDDASLKQTFAKIASVKKSDKIKSRRAKKK